MTRKIYVHHHLKRSQPVKGPSFLPSRQFQIRCIGCCNWCHAGESSVVYRGRLENWWCHRVTFTYLTKILLAGRCNPHTHTCFCGGGICCYAVHVVAQPRCPLFHECFQRASKAFFRMLIPVALLSVHCLMQIWG